MDWKPKNKSVVVLVKKWAMRKALGSVPAFQLEVQTRRNPNHKCSWILLLISMFYSWSMGSSSSCNKGWVTNPEVTQWWVRSSSNWVIRLDLSNLCHFRVLPINDIEAHNLTLKPVPQIFAETIQTTNSNWMVNGRFLKRLSRIFNKTIIVFQPLIRSIGCSS